MSLKSNILANYASQLYVTVIGIVLVPIYVSYMGAEAYGLVGFFAMLQAWFAMLDLGLSPTIARETARYRGGAMSALAYRQLFRSLSLIFFCVAVMGGGLLWSLSEIVSTRWLKVEHLAQTEVVLAVQIMAISVALRWMGGLYRGVITGSERLVWMSGFNAVMATLRFVAVLVSMKVFGFTPFVFFVHQLVVALIEMLGLFLVSRWLLPRHVGQIGWSFRPVQPLLKFGLTIAFTSTVWIMVTQTDKLVLSGILPLAEYGYFTLAVLVAGGILVISGPISSAIMPRMARLNAEGKYEELVRVYRNSTQLVSVVAGSASLTISFFSQQLLFAWTGNYELSLNAAPILTLYAVGNGFLAVSAFPYYLQYAKGDLRYHLLGNVVLVGLMIPAIIYAASTFGAVGAGFVWVVLNFVYLLIWVAYVHRKLLPGLHVSWVTVDILYVVIPALCVAFVYQLFSSFSGSRLMSLIHVFVMALITLFISAGASSMIRPKVKGYLGLSK